MILNSEGLIELSADKVRLKPYQPRPFKPIQYMTDEEIQRYVGGTLIVDTECYPNYFLIAFKHIETQKYIKLELPFNIRLLSWIMHNYKTIGFNSIKYDLSMIWCAFEYQNFDKLKDLSDALILQNLWPKQAEKDFGFTIFKTSHIDLIEVCPLRGSLKLYGARLHAQRIQDLPYSVHHPITDKQKEVVLNYCFNDLDCTELDYVNLSEQLKLRADLSIQYKSDLMSKSDAQIAEAVIGNELKQITGFWPKKPEIDTTHFYQFKIPSNMQFQTTRMQNILQKISEIKFSVDSDGRLEKSAMNDIRIPIGSSIYRMGIGGLHSSEEVRAIVRQPGWLLIDKDVASYYPAIVLNLKLFPQHLGENFLKVYSMLRDRRLAAKRKGQRLKKEIEEASNHPDRLSQLKSEYNRAVSEAECLKISANGTFGKTGSPYSFLYAPEMTIQITVGGQLYLLMLIEQLELQGISVVSANTDGIVIYCPENMRPIVDSIFKAWEQTTGFETEETLYEAIYSRDVNAYLAVKKTKDGYEFKGKNDYYDPWRGKTAKDGYWRFQKNPTHQICIEAIEKYIADNKPIEQTITECRDITKFLCVKNVTGGAHKENEYLGKTIRWYYAKGVYGTINYIKSNNKVAETDGAKPAMDLPENFPEDINFNWYIRKTKEMMQDCGMLKREEQIRFF